MKANMCRKLKCLTSAPARLSVAMPLICGLATIAVAPTVEAVTIELVDIKDGLFDVDRNLVINVADALSNVALWCDDAAPIQVDIIAGFVDVTEGSAINSVDDLVNCDLTDENAGVPISNPVAIINGCVDVNQNGFCNADDDATDVKLFKLP